MSTPPFILELRAAIGTAPLWLSGVTGVVERRPDGAILLVRRADNGRWTPVTGIIDPGEEAATAIEREIREEADLVARAIRLARIKTLPLMTYPNGDQAQYLDLTFHCEYISGEPDPADGENTEARWFARDELPELSDDMRDRIDAALSDDRVARFDRSHHHSNPEGPTHL